MRLYADGVFDLFHFGHARLLEQCKKKFPHVYLIVGVAGDHDTISLKGKPLMNESERAEGVRQCKWVDEVIVPCPWVCTLEFMDLHQIDYICHDDSPYVMGSDEAGDVYSPSKKAGRFLATQRTEGVSTSDLLLRILVKSSQFVGEYTRKDGRVYRRHTYALRRGFDAFIYCKNRKLIELMYN